MNMMMSMELASAASGPPSRRARRSMAKRTAAMRPQADLEPEGEDDGDAERMIDARRQGIELRRRRGTSATVNRNSLLVRSTSSVRDFDARTGSSRPACDPFAAPRADEALDQRQEREGDEERQQRERPGADGVPEERRMPEIVQVRHAARII